jgi:hypothetical protein
MRVAVTVMPILAALATGAIAQDRIPLTADQAVLACGARAGHEIERRHGVAAKPAERFKTLKMHTGWRVSGVYLARKNGAEQRFNMVCVVSAEGIDLAMAIRTD